MTSMASDGRDLAHEGTVTVRGEGVVRAEPDEALVWITLTALEPAPGAALSDVSARSRALVAMLSELGVAAADRTTTGVGVSEEFEHRGNVRRSLGHRASTSMQVRLTDPELIGRLLAQATEQLAARVDGPRWQIAADNPVRLDAAREAAADAQRRARAYADGLGASVGRALRLSEVDDALSVPRFRPMTRALAAAAGAEPAIESGEHEVAASIQVTFALEHDAGRR